MKALLIKEEFEYLDKEMKQLFLKYFHKNIEDSADGWVGSSGHYIGDFQEDHYVSIDKITLSLPEGVNVSVEFTTNFIKGNPLGVEVFADLNETDWNLLIQFLNKAVSKSLAMLLVQKKEKYFFRACFAYMGPPLDGAYYITNFRISPATREGGFFGENYIYLDMDIEAIDYENALTKSKAFGKEVTAILSVILNTGFYVPEYDDRWVLLSDKEHGRFQLGFHDKEPSPNSMPAKDRKKAGGFSENPVDYLSNIKKTLCLPRSIRKLFKAYYNLPADEQAAFLSASRMYHISLTAGRMSTTVRASYQLAALDALSKPYREKNLNKNAIMKLTDRYYSQGEGNKIGELYDSIRNAHFHQGYFDEIELNGFEVRPFSEAKWLKKEIDYLFKTEAVFFVLNNWLSEKISSEVHM